MYGPESTIRLMVMHLVSELRTKHLTHVCVQHIFNTTSYGCVITVYGFESLLGTDMRLTYFLRIWSHSIRTLCCTSYGHDRITGVRMCDYCVRICMFTWYGHAFTILPTGLVVLHTDMVLYFIRT